VTHGQAFTGCAGWSLGRDAQHEFPAQGSHLERYASRLNAAEINSSFYRPHKRQTYERWGESVAASFRFSVKLPKAMTHEARLAGCDALLDTFLDQARGLGPRLGCLLAQLPPSLALDPKAAGRFFKALRARHEGPIAVEPRHASWFTARADHLLASLRLSRVLADPVLHAPGSLPGGWPGTVYLRLHGTPRMYWSSYQPQLLRALAARIAIALREGIEVWCIFDNTASGAATYNALALGRNLTEEHE
jgi:uncharacterized protein YecE (DUF72 family)